MDIPAKAMINMLEYIHGKDYHHDMEPGEFEKQISEAQLFYGIIGGLYETLSEENDGISLNNFYAMIAAMTTTLTTLMDKPSKIPIEFQSQIVRQKVLNLLDDVLASVVTSHKEKYGSPLDDLKKQFAAFSIDFEAHVVTEPSEIENILDDIVAKYKPHPTDQLPPSTN